MLRAQTARCVVCGRDDVDLVADEADIRRQSEELWAFHQRRLRPDTPAARLRDRVAFSEPPPRRIVRCPSCGLVYRDPMERADEEKSRFTREATPVTVLRALHTTQRGFARRQATRLRRIVGAGARVLEVGSYVGAFLAGARDVGLAAEGVDVNEAANDFVRSLGLVVHDGELGALPSDGRFDAIAIWNTFDHLANPRAVAALARARLGPNGVVAIRVPNGAAYARLSRLATPPSHWTGRIASGLLAHNNLLTFPYRVGYSPASLSRLLDDAGFVVAGARGDVLVPTADEWTLPWAVWEEKVVKRVTALALRRRPDLAPWFEIVARRADGHD